MITFGLIGTGKIVASFLDAVKDLDEIRVLAVCSRKEESGRAFADQHGIERAVTSLEELAAMEDLDAVYVASPNCCHFEQSMFLLKHGKHVLCEKPLTSNAREARLLIEEAGKNDRILIEAMRNAYDPGFQKIKELLPQIGHVRRATIQYSQYSSRYDAFKQGHVLNAFNPALSNAAIMDIGVYGIHSLVNLFGMPEKVETASVFLENGMEGAGTLLASYQGMIAEVLYSKITDSSQPSEIQGENGSLLIKTIENPREITVHLRGITPYTVRIGRVPNQMSYEAAEFARMVEENDQQEAKKWQDISLMEMRVMDEARKKAGIVFPADEKN